MPESVIGSYRVTGVLGRGGMGVVYAAEHTLLGRPAAVKVLLPELSQKQEVVQRFFNEARAATAIRHPGIVEIYDFGWTNDGAAFIVMEHLQGETLRARRERAGMPLGTALAVTRQIAGALGAAHAKGIVHRDLKPDNIFLVPDPEVPGGERIKLLDFGIAKLAGSTVGQNMTRTGAVIGTPTYMAPEQCRGVAIDSRADLYSLGCILFELCAGRPPFVGEGEGDVLGAHIYMPPPALGSLVPGLPKEVEALVHRLLAKAPIERVQTADEVIRLIDATSTGISGPRATTAFPHEPSVTAAPPHAAAPPPKAAAPAGTIYSETTLSSAASTAHRIPTVRPPRRRAVLLAVGGGALALTATVVTLVAAGGDDAPAPTAPAPETVAAAGSDDTKAEPPTSPSPPATATPSTPPAASPATAAPSTPSTPPAASPATAAPSTPSTPPAASPSAPPPAPSPSATARSPSRASAPPKTDSPAPSSSPWMPATPPPPPAASTAPEKKVSPAPGAAASSGSSTPRQPAVKRPTESPVPPTPPPPPPPIQLSIESSPPNAELLLDGKPLGRTPYRGTLPRADRDRKLTVRSQGYRDEVISVRGSGPIKQRVKLTPLAHNKGVNPFD